MAILLGSSSPTAPNSFYHDDAGNLVRLDYRNHVYDAWNRLVRVEFYINSASSPLQTRATYTYLGLHQRATGLLDTDQDTPNFAPDELTYHFYDPSWRLLERRVNDSYSGSWASGTIGWDDLDPSGQGSGIDPSVDQYIWGTQYIDQLVYWQHDGDGDGDGDFTDGSNDRRYYAVLDRNFSVIGLKRDTSSEFEERVRYTPYGQAQAFPKADINNDGSASTSDLTTLLGQLGKSIGDGTYTAEADLNHDGSITTSDLTIYLGASGTSIPDGDLSAIGSIVGYDGYLYEQATGLYCVRNRWYDTDTGRWISRDPAEYIDGMALYTYVSVNPNRYSDPLGLQPGMPYPLPPPPGITIEPIKLPYEEWIVPYATPSSDPFDLEDYPVIQKAFRNHPSIQASVTRAYQKIADIARSSVFSELSCTGPTQKQISGSYSAPYNVTSNRTTFPIGRGFLQISYSCRIWISGCETKCDGKMYPSERGHECTISFSFQDSFSDPLDGDRIPLVPRFDPGFPFIIQDDWQEKIKDRRSIPRPE